MEGYTLLRKLRDLINESTADSIMNDRTGYDYLYDAVQDFNIRTKYVTNSTTISLTKGVSDYILPADFVDVALTDPFGRKFVKITYGSNDTFVYNKEYASGTLEKRTGYQIISSTAQATASFTTTSLSGVATATSLSTNGECSLTDVAGTFAVSNAGDFVHNITTGTDGIICLTPTTTSSTTVTTALFNDGASGAGWTAGNAYTIVYQPRWAIRISPAPQESATCTVKYVQRIAPVYSLYRSYPLPFNYTLPIVQYAAYLYKCKNNDPTFGDQFLKYYEYVIGQIIQERHVGDSEATGEEKKLLTRTTQAGAVARARG